MSEQVSLPMPFSLVDVHFCGTWPQFNLQDMKGVGTPTASQTRIRVSPGFSLIFDGEGGRVT